MQARLLPAARGVFWLFEGFRLFRRNPPLITAVTLVYLLAVQLFALLPLIGPVLLPVLLPAMTLTVANACRIVDRQQPPSKRALLAGLSGRDNNFPALLRLGGLQLAGALLVVLFATLIGGGEDPFANALLSDAPDAPVDPAMQAAVLGKLAQVLLLATPLIIAFWFAPFLVGWDSVTPAKSLFFSTVASLRNWRAMVMFSLAAIIVAGILPGFILILVAQISGMALSAAFVVLRMVLVFLVAPVLTASIYASYRDIFTAADATHA
ncbi:BPSS1780 family membrane protein [Sulfuricystis multivorans]|uniref:BPSS1780 family membrane protein n=1 Tax=Sulfuricystis multivorans TaxID=2211108 RepID=UPI000F8173E2|nr:BPSS1780 family membrane protein [Sulfuricystis multivorans]